MEAEMRHTIKCHPESFQSVWDGIQTFQVRKNDRNYQVGDSIAMLEWDPTKEVYTGRALGARISYLVQGKWGLPNDLTVMSLNIFSRYLDIERQGKR